MILNNFVRNIHRITTKTVDKTFQKIKCTVLNRFEPYLTRAIIRISILIMFAIKIIKEPVSNIFMVFFGFRSIVRVSKIKSK